MNARYRAATVFVDQYSGYGYVHLQKSTGAEETLEGKRAFEMICRQHGVTVRHYHADNGSFKAHAWKKACMDKEQGFTYAGVNAHHTNGLAERRIRSLQTLARSMLIEVNRRWHLKAAAVLWPYTIKMASDVLNNTPNVRSKMRRTPMQTFSNTEVQPNQKHWAPFGCPAFVLDRKLQEGKRISKWEYRARIGIYLGRSPAYGRNVSLILNRETGHVSPQFHIRLDPTYKSIDSSIGHKWVSKAGLSAKECEAGQVETPPLTPSKHANTNPHREGTSKRRRLSAPKMPEDYVVDVSPDTNDDAQASTLNHIENNPPSDEGVDPPHASEGEEGGVNMDSDPAQTSINNGDTPDATTGGSHEGDGPSSYTDIHDNQVVEEVYAMPTMFGVDNALEDENYLHAFKASSDPDTMYHHQAMQEPDRDRFREAMTKEWDGQANNKNFTLMRRSDVPEGATILPAVWQMRRKRDVKTGEIKKYKARLNLDGSRMVKHKHYDLTYAPVVKWYSIRMMLALALVNNWHTQQIDYVLAYPQAPIEREIYMKIPRGMEIGGKDKNDFVLKLHRNIYGQKQAGRVWYQYLSKKLVEEVGFTKSEVDECVFTKGEVMYILYTDDSIIAAPKKSQVEEVMRDIEAAGLKITREGNVQDFLGINIEKKGKRKIKMSQPNLTRQILKALRLDEESKGKNIPAASSKVLTRHPSSEEFDGSFNYRSVIGQLNYLEKGTRMDIAYQAHQCARYTENPKVEHGKAVKWLGRYLKNTVNRGITIEPDDSKGLEVFVDSDFAGLWDRTDTDNRDTARSRHGYIIMYNRVPIVWKSQLQSEIAMSTTEAEYTGLSYALREAIPIMNLLKELKSRGFEINDQKTKVHCKVFEDNSGAIEIAREDKYRPRTKHLNIRLHHFRTYIENGSISIHKIDSEDQPADLLTKPLDEETFSKHRQFLMGW